MTAKPTILLLLSLMTIAFSASTPTEPNGTAPEPRIEIGAWPRNRPIEWEDRRAWYIAEVTLHRHRDIINSKLVRVTMEKSPLIQKLSQAQKDLLAESGSVSVWTHPNISRITLYAVCEEDAKTMGRALLDGLTTRAREARTEHKRRLEELEQQRERKQVELAEKQERLRGIKAQYDQDKKHVYPHLGDDEAAQLAKERIIQMGKEADTLDIELAGIRAKLEVIDEYLSWSDLDNHVIERLETMRIDQMIELSGLDARRKAVERIRTTQQQFRSLYDERVTLHSAIGNLRDALAKRRQTIETMAAELERTSSPLVPPEESENKVMIYPIVSEGSQN